MGEEWEQEINKSSVSVADNILENYRNSYSGSHNIVAIGSHQQLHVRCNRATAAPEI
jgi:hypothetical protein